LAEDFVTTLVFHPYSLRAMDVDEVGYPESLIEERIPEVIFVTGILGEG